MRFLLHVRNLKEQDLCSATPVLPDEDEYEMYLDALREELSFIDGVIEVARNASTLKIEIADMISAEDVRTLIRPAFSQSIMTKLRVVSLIEDREAV